MPDATPAALTPEQAQAQTAIDAIRADVKHPFHDPMHPRHASATEELMNLYRTRHGGEATTTIGPAPTETLDRPALDADTGLVWNEPVLAEVEQAATTAGIPDHVGTALSLVADLARAPRVSREEAEAILERQWGADFEDQLEAASEAWDRLARVSPRAARSLTQAGIRWQPRFVSFMALGGARLRRR